MSRRKGIKNQSQFIQSNFLIPLLIVMMIFMTAREAASQTDSLSMNFSYCSSFVGPAAYDVAGWDVAFVGDVNKDGYEDLLIGASENNKGGLQAGAAYLIFGSNTLPPVATSLIEADVIFVGEKSEDEAEMNVAGVGDVNGDGFSDFMIAAPIENASMGKVYLFFGKKDGWKSEIKLSEADASFIGENWGDNAGIAIASAGDVNKDDLADFLIGAPRSDSKGYDVGKAYLILGKKSGWTTNVSLANADVTFIGEAMLDLFGSSVAGIGDVNKDGYDDIATAAPFHDGNEKKDNGKVYIFFGKETFNSKIDAASADASLMGSEAEDLLGKYISNGADVNGDGIDDFSVTASLANASGKIYLILGKSTGWSQNAIPENLAPSYIGEQQNDCAGIPMLLKDLNEDGLSDLLIGASKNSQVDNQTGKVYFIEGKATDWSQNESLANADIFMMGEKAHDLAGHAIASGDFDGDGYTDVVVGSPGSDIGGENAGIAYLYHSPYKPITAWLTLTSPNGGENWLSGSEQLIVWDSEGDIEYVTLEYSTDNGVNWNTIVENTANDGDYLWIVPEQTSTQCLISVEDASDGDPYDKSDQVFTIFAPVVESIEVITPNGGECWLAGTEQEIKWTSQGSIQNVRIEYSSDGGQNWAVIVQNTPNDGSYQWTVSEVHSKNCLIKVVDIDCYPEDISNAPFTIWGKSLVTVISPNGGECLKPGQKFEIKWEACCCLDSVKILYSTDGGKEWAIIVKSTPNDSSYLWKVPEVHSTDCLVKVADLDYDIKDISDKPFTIWDRAPVTVVYPNGGECLKAGDEIEIKWEAYCGLDSLKIQYSTDGGKDWTMIVYGTENDGSYIWKVPDVHSNNCLIKVADLDCDPEDISDKPFTIWGKAPITVVYPNGGECLKAGDEIEIKWKAYCGLNSLKIQYSTDGGKNWTMIVYGTENDGSYIWKIPDVHSNNCLIKVADLDCDPEDNSDKSFTIWDKAPVTVIYPNGGECLTAGDGIKIKWEAYCGFDSLKIQYSTDGGKDWTMIVYGTENDGSYTWKVPNVHSNNCLIKVADLDCDPEDNSDKPFTIWGKAPITVIAPNGGECLKAGDQFKIKWEASYSLDSLKIQYSIDGGKDWTTIVYGTENDSCHTWTIPEVNSDSCLIKVADLDCDPDDVSDKFFTICAPPFVTVFQPNGGEMLQTDQEYDIKWHACCFIDTVKIQYSIDGGENWINIIYRTENDGLHIWQIPNTPSDKCLIKVADTDCDPFDVSDRLFMIVSAPMAEFDASVMTGSEPLEVKFMNLSTGHINQWRWDFGDGKSSDEKEPIHRYNQPGVYTVKLLAFYPTGIDSITKTNYIWVHQKETFAELEVVNSTPTLPQYDWSNAIDGDIYGWDGTTVLVGDQPNIIFSLADSANKPINSVGLITDTGIGYEDRWIRHFQIQVSNSGIESDDFQTVLDTVMTTGEMEVFSIQPVRATYIKLVVKDPQNNLVLLGEFQAYFGEGTVTSVQSEVTSIPNAFRLAQNYPNPFNPGTTIRFELPKASRVKLEIYNLLGEKIRTLINDKKPAGAYEVNWDGKNKHGIVMPSGVYLYIFITSEHREVRKMILAK